jgi:aminopeptidase
MNDLASFSVLLDRYADLVATVGMNVQPGQIVAVRGEVIHRELMFRIARRAYQKGAKLVQMDLIEPRLGYERVVSSSDEDLDTVSEAQRARFNELVDQRGATCRIVGEEDPLLMSELDPNRVNRAEIGARRALKRFYDEGISKNLVQWTICAGSTPGWASRVFPELAPEEAHSRLWHEIFRITRVDTPDYLERWEAHNNALSRRERLLNSLDIASLHITGPGTDLTVGLSPKARFVGGAKHSVRGALYEANIPTEECFTTPDWRETHGVARVTRPVTINGVLVRDIVLEFSEGTIVRTEASSGKETLDAYLDSDVGARRLGEIALVGVDSPIYRSGLLFEEILFDENAACHFAVGSAYHYCLEGGPEMSKEERESIGCNDSLVHTDFMISDDTVDVRATLRSGEKRFLLEKGEWQGDLR